ncbi:amino acid permease [Leucobacter allii]|uniref:APC family permease n=1 Tax=Leucobacter allii TaxID=2932247 RepID=UPI001FD2E448|nr:amino acid permease [Leucobacter allii]UOR01295.1 amino acid permease [Leucobacter allii]
MSAPRTDPSASPPAAQAPESGVMKREFTLWSAFSLAFVFVSPIVAMYGIFGLGLTAVGPAFWWGWVVTLLGQLTVAIALGVLASRWPLAGGVYQWSRRLVGPRYGWFAGWAYTWALLIALSSVSYSGSVFIAILLGLDATSPSVLVTVSVLFLVVTTAVNIAGRRVVKLVATACIVAEIVGSLGVAVYLLVFGREQQPAFLLEGLSPAPETPFMMTPFVFLVAIAGWSFLGFESASSIAEEVKNPKHAVPRAIVFSLLGVGLVILFTSFAILLAIPDLPAILAASEGDPIIAVLAYHFPPVVVDAILVMFIIAFLASLVGIQAAASRLVWANAREGELPGAAWLKRLRGEGGLPANAVLVTGVLAILVLLVLQNEYASTLLVAFTTVGFYVAFAFPVLGLAIAKARGTWRPGERLFMGRFGTAMSWVALVWLALEITNVLWPREAPELWWVNSAPFIASAVVAAAGLVVHRLSPVGRGLVPTSPALDARTQAAPITETGASR